MALSGNRLLLDLDYEEDFHTAVDDNFVATGKGDLVEVQAKGEGCLFPEALMDDMLVLAQKDSQLRAHIQEGTLAPWLPLPW